MPIASRPYHHGDLRAALVKSALARVEEAGPEGVSVAALAKEIGVSQAAAYRHFASREALLSAVAVVGFENFTKAVEQGANFTPSLDRIVDASNNYLKFGLERAGLYRLLFVRKIDSDANELSTVYSIALSRFLSLLETGQTAPSRCIPPPLALWSLLHGLVIHSQNGLLKPSIAHILLKGTLQRCFAESDIDGETEGGRPFRLYVGNDDMGPTGCDGELP